jgi:hypothetical protein
MLLVVCGVTKPLNSARISERRRKSPKRGAFWRHLIGPQMPSSLMTSTLHQRSGRFRLAEPLRE